MFKLPQTQRLMKLVTIITCVIFFICVIMAPELFFLFFVLAAFIIGGMAVVFKLFEWICFGSDK